MWNIYDYNDQYICYIVLYLLLMLGCTYDIIIDCEIGSPGHSNDSVDILNLFENKSTLMVTYKLTRTKVFDNLMSFHIST